MAEQMKIQIGADVSGAVSGLNQVAAATGKTTSALNKLPKSSNEATQSLVNLSRVAQDAPYGFIGIANNLNPLLESFQRLKASTGTTGGALKELGKSLTGAGGIGLAIGVVSSLLVVFGDRLFGASKAAKAAEDAAKKLGEGIASSAAKLTVLVGIVQNVNASYEDKQKALQAINQEYGKYLTNLQSEKVTLENVELAYDAIIDKMIRQAVVKGIQDQITESVTKTASAIVQLEINQKKITQAQNKKNESDRQLIDVTKQTDGIIRDGNLAYINREQVLSKTTKGQFDYAIEVRKLTESLKSQLSPLLQLTDKYSDLDIALSKGIKIKVNAKKADFSFKFPEDEFIEIPEINIKPNPKLREDFEKQIFEQLQTDEDIKIPVGSTIELEQADKAQKEFEKNFDAFASNINSSITNSLQDLVAGAAEGIGEVLTGGNLGDVFKGFANIIGSGLQAIGKQLINVAVLAKITQKALKTLFTNPGLALATGIALIAAGSALKNALGKGISGRKSGGPISGGTPYIVGEDGPELIVPSSSGRVINNASMRSISSGNFGGNVTFEIEGQKLVGVLSRANNYNLRNV